MIALINAFDYVHKHYVGRQVTVYSDSRSSLDFLISSAWKRSISDTKVRLITAFRLACQVNTVKLVHVPGHVGIWQNEAADRAAKKVLSEAAHTDTNCDIAAALSLSRDFRATTPAYALRPRVPRSLPLQTRSTLYRASAALGTFLLKMFYDCGKTNARLHRHDLTADPSCRLCGAEHETPEHLWVCSGAATAQLPTLDDLVQNLQIDQARIWLHALSTLGV